MIGEYHSYEWQDAARMELKDRKCIKYRNRKTG